MFLSLPHQWENHNKSLQLEAQTYQRIQEKIQERVMNNLGTWIDWQYLHNAAKLLAKVLHTEPAMSVLIAEAASQLVMEGKGVKKKKGICAYN